MEKIVAVSENVDAFLTFLRNAEQRYAIAQTEADEAEQQSQDIFHAVEFGNYNVRKTASLVKKLQVVRQNRRKAKNEVEIMSMINAWAQEYAPVIKSLEQLLGELRKAERRMKNRAYTPRTNIMED